MFIPFRMKNKKFSPVAKISRIERISVPKRDDKVLELLYFDDCDYPCINWLHEHFEEGDYVQFYPFKVD